MPRRMACNTLFSISCYGNASLFKPLHCLKQLLRHTKLMDWCQRNSNTTSGPEELQNRVLHGVDTTRLLILSTIVAIVFTLFAYRDGYWSLVFFYLAVLI